MKSYCIRPVLQPQAKSSNLDKKEDSLESSDNFFITSVTYSV